MVSRIGYNQTTNVEERDVGLDFKFPEIYKHIDTIVRGNEIDLSECEFIHPWCLVLICLLLVERHTLPDKKLILPKSKDVLKYLKRAHFGDTLKELEYNDGSDDLDKFAPNEKDNLGIFELKHCINSDDFNARLDRLLKVFGNFGLDENQARLAVALVGELGNNVYDHNLGNWPTDVSGCFITAQNYQSANKRWLEFIIGDPGIGFQGSLRNVRPDLNDDIKAINLGLSGVTGWVNTKRGNGLQFVQKNILEKFFGNLLIHSGDGLVVIEKANKRDQRVNRIQGTLIQIMLYYDRC